MQHPVTVNGASLDQWAYQITTRNGWQSTPGVRAVSVEAAHVDGVLVPDRRAPLEPGQFAVSMFVRGSSWPEYLANLDTLRAIFGTQRGTVEVTMDTGDGTMRVCQARTVASWTPEHINPLIARFTVVMEIPSGVWTSPGYYLAAGTAIDITEPVTVECWDPTATITDAQLLLRDPGAAVRWTLSDASVDTMEAQRIWLRLALPAPVAADRSLLFDLGGWSVIEVSRPDAVDVDEDWFTGSHVALADHTSIVTRNGPMFGGSLLPLESGTGPLPPRQPGIRLDSIDADDIPTYAAAVVLAVRPAWL